MSKKHSKKQSKYQDLLPELDFTQIDEDLLLDPDWFYWNFIRPAEEADEDHRQKRAARRAKQKTKVINDTVIEERLIELPTKPQDENELIQVMRGIIETTYHANGWRHLGELGQQLQQHYTNLQWSDYNCKKLMDFLQKYPEAFRIKRSAPTKKGASHVWVRLMDYQKDEQAP